MRSSRNGKAAAAAETNLKFDGLEGYRFTFMISTDPDPRNEKSASAELHLSFNWVSGGISSLLS
jgi:hypothetical protein